MSETHLEILDLSNNLIKNLAEQSFVNLKCLKQLNLSINKMAELKDGTFKYLNGLKISHLLNRIKTSL